MVQPLSRWRQRLGKATTDGSSESPKARIQLYPIPEARKRKSTFKKRKEGLLKKVGELHALCDVDVCLFVTGHAGPKIQRSRDANEPEVKFVSCVLEVERILGNYEQIPLHQRLHKSYNYVSQLESQMQKTTKESDNILNLNNGLRKVIAAVVGENLQAIQFAKSRLDAQLLLLTAQGGEGRPKVEKVPQVHQAVTLDPNLMMPQELGVLEFESCSRGHPIAETPSQSSISTPDCSAGSGRSTAESDSLQLLPWYEPELHLGHHPWFKSEELDVDRQTCLEHCCRGFR